MSGSRGFARKSSSGISEQTVTEQDEVDRALVHCAVVRDNDNPVFNEEESAPHNRGRGPTRSVGLYGRGDTDYQQARSNVLDNADAPDVVDWHANVGHDPNNESSESEHEEEENPVSSSLVPLRRSAENRPFSWVARACERATANLEARSWYRPEMVSTFVLHWFSLEYCHISSF